MGMGMGIGGSKDLETIGNGGSVCVDIDTVEDGEVVGEFD